MHLNTRNMAGVESRALVPIGIAGLKTLAYGLLTVAAEMEAAQ